MTPILLPPEWESMILGDFAEVKYGKARPKTSGSIPVIGSGGEYGRTSTPLIDFPTIVIGRKGTAGLAWLQEQPCWPSDTTFYLQWKSKIIDRDYLYYYLQAKPLSGQHAKTTLPSILKQDLEKYSILAPPLPEQRAIARALRAVRGAREALLLEVALEKERKAALMEHLFTHTHGTRGEATKKTEIGEMPESWKVVQLGTLLISGLRNGLYKSAEFFNKGFAKIIELSNIYNSNSVLKVDDTMRSIEATQEEIDRYSLNDGDIIINRVSKRREGVAQARLLCLSDNIGVPVLYESNMFRATLNDELIILNISLYSHLRIFILIR